MEDKGNTSNLDQMFDKIFRQSQIEYADSLEGDLIISGQGTVEVVHKEGTLIEKIVPFNIDVKCDEENLIRLRGEKDEAIIFEIIDGKENELIRSKNKGGFGLDPDPKAIYWLSVFGQNRTISYGKGEKRLLTTLLTYTYPEPEDPEKSPQDYWMNKLETYTIYSNNAQGYNLLPLECKLWRNPVTVEPPLVIVNNDVFTMDDIANQRAIVSGSLPIYP